jgi:hypothetical protein
MVKKVKASGREPEAKAKPKGKKSQHNDASTGGQGSIPHPKPGAPVIDFARYYLWRKLDTIPVDYMQKSPKKGWKTWKVTLENVEQWFPPHKQLNVSVRLGKDGLADNDLDCMEAIMLADHFLPPTPAMFGRASKPRSHRLYYLDNLPEDLKKATLEFSDENDATIVELRLGAGGKGAHTIFPGSTHESSEAIEWYGEFGEIPHVDYAVAKQGTTKVACGALLLRHWPGKGSRQTAALIVGGFFARLGWSADDIAKFVYAIAKETNDEEVEKRVAAARNSAENYAKGEEHIYGLPKLREFFGEEPANLIAKYVGYGGGGSEQLEELNSKYCVVKVGGKTRVLSFREEETGRSVPQYETCDDFKNFMQNRYVGQKKLGHWWLEHRDRRQYGGVVYRPGQPEVVSNCLNLWRGFGIKPQPGDWSLMRKHIKEVLAAGKQEVEDYILNWTAWTFQNPGTPAEVALVFRGGRGTGKGVFARTVCRIFGQHGLHISSIEHLVGRFNDQLQDCSLLYADEAYFPGDKRSESTLKRMITESTLFIEPKGLGKFTILNCLHLIMTGQEDWIVPAGIDERRFVVNNVAEIYKQKETWFKPLYKEIEEGGAAAMLYDFTAQGC